VEQSHFWETKLGSSSSSSSGSTVLCGPWPLDDPPPDIPIPFPRAFRLREVYLLQGEFSSILTKCRSHLNLTTCITLTVSRSLHKPYSSSLYSILQTPFSKLGSASQKNPSFFGTEMFITLFTTAYHQSLSVLCFLKLMGHACHEWKKLTPTIDRVSTEACNNYCWRHKTRCETENDKMNKEVQQRKLKRNEIKKLG
jgi:hypothetical protein